MEKDESLDKIQDISSDNLIKILTLADVMNKIIIYCELGLISEFQDFETFARLDDWRKGIHGTK